MKKFIFKKLITGVSKKFKGVQKIPAQKAPSRFTSVMSEATVKANQRKILGDVPEFMGLSSKATGTLAAESLAIRTGNKKFFNTLKTELKRSRHRTVTGIKSIKKFKPVSKLGISKAKSKGANESWLRSNKAESKTYGATMEKLTGRFKLNPSSIRTAPAKKGLREGTKLRREGQRIIDQNKKLKKDWGF